MTSETTPSRRTGLRDAIAAALEAADYRRDMRRGDLADAVLPVLYREWPWLRAEADGPAPVAKETDAAEALEKRLQLAHQARRAKEHQLDDIRRALCDARFMEDDDPYSHADLADVIRQAGEAAQAENGRLRERLRLLTDEKVAYVTGPTTDLLCEEINRLKAEVAAARGFAGEMRDFCSPHGVSVGYADRLVEVMDRAKEQGQKDLDGTPRGPVLAEYVRMKGQLEADLRKMTACAAQPPRPGAEKVRAMQGGIAAGICSSLAWAIQCFEGPAARGAFLKRVEGAVSETTEAKEQV